MDMPEEGDSANTLVIGVPLGVAIPLNEYVSVDAGLKVLYMKGMSDMNKGALLHIPVGYFGVRGFF
jgi:hypothetical protein